MLVARPKNSLQRFEFSMRILGCFRGLCTVGFGVWSIFIRKSWQINSDIPLFSRLLNSITTWFFSRTHSQYLDDFTCTMYLQSVFFWWAFTDSHVFRWTMMNHLRHLRKPSLRISWWPPRGIKMTQLMTRHVHGHESSMAYKQGQWW